MDADANFAIEVTGLDFSYERGPKALDCVDFFANKGEFVSILASNGSGKTTLIKVMVSVLNPQRGQIRIWGKTLNAYRQNELFQLVGLVLQNPKDQLFAATVADDVAFGPRNLGLGEAEVISRVDESLESVGAAQLKTRAIHHLSFGEQKRVCIAGVLAMRPSVLILDEPTAGLDPEGELLMLRLLDRLNRENGITVVLATHSLDMLPLFADRIYIMKNGRVRQQGTVDQVFSDQEVLQGAGLRLPYIAELVHQLKRFDGVPINGLPLTLKDARCKLLRLIPTDLIQQNARETTP